MKESNPFRIPATFSPRLSPQALLANHRKLALPIVIPKRHRNLEIKKQLSPTFEQMRKLTIAQGKEFNQFVQLALGSPKDHSHFKLYSEPKRHQSKDNRSFSFRRPKFYRFSSQAKVIDLQQAQNQPTERKLAYSQTPQEEQFITFYPKIKKRQAK